MAWNNKNKEGILELSEGILESAVDLSIFCALIGLDILSLMDKRRLYYPKTGDSDWVPNALEKINYKSIKRAIGNSRNKGWIKLSGNKRNITPEITKAGLAKMESKIPVYDKLRVWDGVFHLVTYDVPEEKKKNREVLRSELIKIGCGMLQKSVYITPYIPNEELRDFIRDRGLKGEIIISTVGRDGSIGGENIVDLVYKVYKLDKLNKRYEKYIKEYKNCRANPLSSSFVYLSILRDDPQLPYELLPKDWLGDKANKTYKAITAEFCDRN